MLRLDGTFSSSYHRSNLLLDWVISYSYWKSVRLHYCFLNKTDVETYLVFPGIFYVIWGLFVKDTLDGWIFFKKLDLLNDIEDLNQQFLICQFGYTFCVISEQFTTYVGMCNTFMKKLISNNSCKTSHPV